MAPAAAPVRLSTRSLLLAAVAIWIVVKVPQEYLLHVARLGLADVIKEKVLADRSLAQLLTVVAAVVGSLTVIFARIVPGMDASPTQLVGGVTVFATLNSLLLHRARTSRPVASAVLSFLVLALTNVVFVLAVHLVLRRHHGGLSVSASVFFLLLLSLIVTLYDRWHPVFDERFGLVGTPTGSSSSGQTGG